MNKQSAASFPGHSRIHIALAVKDLQKSQTFYETLLGQPPTKERPGYVKFEPQEPSINLALNEIRGTTHIDRPATHYGIQVKSTQAVRDAMARLSAAGLETSVEENTLCCYAVQDKVWVADPEGNRWEVFVVLDADTNQKNNDEPNCCATESTQSSTNPCC